MRLSDAELQWMQTRLAQRYAAAGREVRAELERQLSALPPEQALLTGWCYAASPLSDWANYDFSIFHACAAHALFLRERLASVRALPEQLFLNYVLHPRVNEEELCDCRGMFYAQLEKRIRGLPAREAILEINCWNAEQVCYRATDERTISALGAWRSGFGRCGEESTFAVNALRAAGIPARQVYTPRWAHCDDNHAWVEVFCDGAWHYLGACEPEPELDRGWFTGAASRAILVHSRLFGRAAADDAVISADGAVTFLNQTARYAPVRTLTVSVREPDGQPSAGAEVTFGVVNAAQIFPAAVVRTDGTGAARLSCGYGDLIVQVQKHALRCEVLCPAAQQTLELTLTEPEPPSGCWTAWSICAPKEHLPARKAPDPAEKARIAEKLAAANEKRRLRTEAAYDASHVQALCAQLGCGAEIEPLLRAACGNFSNLAAFLADPAFAPEQKLALLRTLSEKDLRDVRPEVLREALMSAADGLPPDEFTMRYLLCPRIDTEPLACWRQALADSFPEAQKQKFREAPDKLWRWIRETIRQAPETEYRQLVTLPAGALRLRCADLRSQRLLFAALCRTFGIAARLDPHSGAAEYASAGRFLSPEEGQTPCAALRLKKQPGQTWQPGADFGLSVFTDGSWQPLELSGLSWQDDCMTVPLCPGVYRILTDSRLPSGDLHVLRLELRLDAGQSAGILLQKQPAAVSELVVDFTLPEFQAEAPDGRWASAAELTQGLSLLLWLDAGSEPTEHLLNELLASRGRIRGLRIVLLLPARQALQNKTLRAVLAAIPEAEVWLSADSAEPAARSAYVSPDSLPLLLLCDRPRHIIHACAGYRIGSIDTALAFCQPEAT